MRDVKRIQQYLKHNLLGDEDCEMTDVNGKSISDLAQEQYWKKFDESIRMGLLQANRYAMIRKQMADAGEIPYLIGGEKLTRTYFITIRPDVNKIQFKDFFIDCCTYLQRECFEHFICTFEQKGTCQETLGQGFHIHILAKMTQRSKGEVLRDTKPTFIQYTAENCIQVDIVKNKENSERVLGYIRDYKAKDGHKKITADADQLWRSQLGLQNLYTDVPMLPPSIKSDVGGQQCYTITFAD